MKLRHYLLAVTPLSPVHMGTGSDYEPTGYVIDEGALFEFDAIAALEALPAAERTKLDRILSGNPADEMLREVQGFFFANRERLIPWSRRQVRVNPSVEAFYKERVGKGKAQNKLEIERTAWNPVTGKPILPGSGLKGAIRTALLNEENDGNSLKKVPDLKTGRNRDEKNTELQNRLFDYRAGKFELDPMRLIQLADAPLRSYLELPTEVMFALNRKKRLVEKGGTLVQSQAEQRNLYQLLECLPPLRARAFESVLTVQDLDGVGENGKTVPRLRFDISAIADACNRFYHPIMEHELQLLRQRGYVDAEWAGAIERLLNRMQPAFEGGRAFLLRAGRHSGAESVTLNGVRNIKIMKGKGEKPDWLDSAKTLWLAGRERQDQRGLLPFGWLLVEIDPQDTESPIGGTSANQELTQWAEQVRSRIESMHNAVEQARAEALARQRREVEEAQRRQAEEAARIETEAEEAARMQAEFDALSEADKRLHKFNQDLETVTGVPPLNKDDYAQLAGMLNQLSGEATSWEQVADRVKAAAAIEAACERFGWTPSGLDSKRRKKQEQKRRELIAKLRT